MTWQVLAAHDVTTALIALSGVVITAAFGFAAVLVQAHRTDKKVDANAAAISRVEDHVNRSEEQVLGTETTGPMTFRQEMRAGFTRNEQAHEILTRGIDETARGLRDHGERISNVEREIGLDG